MGPCTAAIVSRTGGMVVLRRDGEGWVGRQVQQKVDGTHPKATLHVLLELPQTASVCSHCVRIIGMMCI
jgi:hypothetical protein